MRISYFIIILIVLTGLISAQPGRNRFNGFQTGYMNFTCNYIPLNLGSLDTYMNDLGLDEFNDFILTWGAELTGNINPNFSAGVQYYTGWEEKNDMVTVPYDTLLVDLDRNVQFKLNYFGVNFNYRKSFLGTVEYFSSMGINYGTADLIFTQDEGDQWFEDLIASLDPESDIYEFNRSSIISMNMWLFTLSTGLKYYITSRVALGASIGYTYGLLSDEADLNYGFETIKNVPELDFDGISYSLSLYFGK